MPVNNDTDLTTAFSEQDYIDVADDDDVRVDQATNGNFSAFMFKDKHLGEATVSVSWNGQSTLAPTISPVILQVFNRTSSLWETLASNSIAGANTDFTVVGEILTSVEDYFDAEFWVSCRVYQEAAE